MSTITHKFYIERLYVRQYDGMANAVARVHWMCVMKRNGAKLFAAGVTDLNEPNPGNFLNIGELEAQTVIDWVVEKEGGELWVAGLVAAHEEAMQNAEVQSQFEPWHIPLINPLKFDPANV
jgi:hypothetical protein